MAMTGLQADNGVVAVVVAFHPSADALGMLLGVLAPQVRQVIVVDNTPGADGCAGRILSRLDIRNVILHRLGENLGIGKALNVGVGLAIQAGASHVLLSDQDSQPDPKMVEALLDRACKLAAQGVKVGCLCPEYFDQTSGQRFRFQVQRPGRLFYSSVAADPDQDCLEIITSISSGTLIPLATIEVVGGMREDFFIDHVDTEWCHRARAQGFRNFGTPQARLLHRLGDDDFRVWYLGWQSYSVYPPLRLYYRFRNFVVMCRLPHVPLRWAVRAGWYWLGNLYAHTLFAPRRLANTRAIALGILDGMRGLGGKATRRF